MSTITEELDRIVAHVARHGVARSEPQLRRTASMAIARQVQPSIVAVLTDRAAPDVVRSRAFARVVAGLRASPHRAPAFAAA